ncbi:MAG: DUF1461 domain-containing protein [Coriobacteriia bacterium]|nr:DUF1461 domain-containing protein [Coriobacteriia bacterium]
MGSTPVVALVKAGAALFLAVTFVAAGLLACTLPVTTEMLAARTADVSLSPFGQEQLINGAKAIRDYSFGSHDLRSLRVTQYQLNQELARERGAVSPASLQLRPQVDPDADATQLTDEELTAPFAHASQRYCLDEAAISHLDDVHAVISTATPILVIIALLAVAAAAHVVFYRGWAALAPALLGAGGATLAAFVLLGIGAAVDFQGFFALFHSLFFEGQSWVFPYDSLLICCLPQGFWVGMGAVWLAVAAALSILSLILGTYLLKKARIQEED